MPPRTEIDTRRFESAQESHARFLRCVQADIVWWRENASAIPDRAMKDMALEIAAELERVLDQVRAKSAAGASRRPAPPPE